MKVLAIGAHADDVELGAGGSIAKHAFNGHEVHVLIVTHSGYSNFDGKKIRSKKIAKEEAIEASRIMGVKKLHFLDYETKHVMYNVDLIEDINKVIVSIKPDIIYTHWDGDINQDHSAIAQATIVAARSVPRVLMYRSNWYKSYKHFENSFYNDITGFVDTKIKAIGAHKSEIEKRGPAWVNFFVSMTTMNGQEIGVENAESFKVIKWLMK